MGLLLMRSCVTSLSVVILLTIQGVCGEEWSVKYLSKSICAFVGSSVDMSCSYTYPNGLTITEVYWTKHNNQYKDPPRLLDDPEYSNRISEVCQYGTKRCVLNIKSLTDLDIGEYYCRITINTEGQKWTGTPGIHLDIKDAPQISVSISPHGNIQEGTDVTLTCTSTSDLPVRRYIWYKTVSLIASWLMETGKTYTIKHIKPEESGLYSCRSEYECGFRDSSTHLQVLYPPKNTRIGSDPSGEITEGSTVTLTCMSEADPPVHTYTWIKKSGAVELKSGKEKTLIFSKIRYEDRGEYLCQAVNRIGQQDSPAVSVQVIYTPKITTVFTRPSGVIAKGSSVTLTCSSDAYPPVEIYTWFKVNESTPVGSGQQYSITNIRSEDGVQYYCEARNTYGAGNSSIVSVIVEAGEQSQAMTAVITVSVCGLLGLFCGVFCLSKKCKKEMLAKGRNEQDAGDSFGNTQRMNPNTIQMSSIGQSLNANTIQPDAVYQGLDPNTIQPDAVYQSLDPNTIQPDAVYQGLDPNTIQPDAVYQSLNPKP